MLASSEKSKLRLFLTLQDAEKPFYAFVSSRLSYCDALLTGIPGESLQRLQYVQNYAASFLVRGREHKHHQIHHKIPLIAYH